MGETEGAAKKELSKKISSGSLQSYKLYCLLPFGHISPNICQLYIICSLVSISYLFLLLPFVDKMASPRIETTILVYNVVRGAAYSESIGDARCARAFTRCENRYRIIHRNHSNAKWAINNCWLPLRWVYNDLWTAGRTGGGCASDARVALACTDNWYVHLLGLRTWAYWKQQRKWRFQDSPMLQIFKDNESKCTLETQELSKLT